MIGWMDGWMMIEWMDEWMNGRQMRRKEKGMENRYLKGQMERWHRLFKDIATNIKSCLSGHPWDPQFHIQELKETTR